MPHKRAGTKYWQIRVNGVRQSSGCAEYADALRVERESKRLAALQKSQQTMEAMKHEVLGIKPPRPWQEAVVRSLKERAANRSLQDSKQRLRWLDQHLGQVKDIRKISRELVDEIMLKRDGVNPAAPCPENATANRYVAEVTTVLTAACREWDWIERVPKFRRYPEPQGRSRWLSVEEWRRLEKELPPHLRRPATFALATGLRDSKVFGLRWDQVDMKGRRLTFTGTANKLGNTIPLIRHRPVFQIARPSG